MAKRGNAGIALTLEGFDELVKKIEAAGGSVNGAVDSCMRQSAQIQQEELKKQMRSAKVSSRLIERMPAPSVEWSGNTCIAEVGYEKGDYDPKNPSDGYKVVFLNYGTPHRKTHGHVKARGFIKKAKAKAKPAIKAAQQEALETILRGLEK